MVEQAAPSGEVEPPVNPTELIDLTRSLLDPTNNVDRANAGDQPAMAMAYHEGHNVGHVGPS